MARWLHIRKVPVYRHMGLWPISNLSRTQICGPFPFRIQILSQNIFWPTSRNGKCRDWLLHFVMLLSIKLSILVTNELTIAIGDAWLSKKRLPIKKIIYEKRVNLTDQCYRHINLGCQISWIKSSISDIDRFKRRSHVPANVSFSPKGLMLWSTI